MFKKIATNFIKLTFIAICAGCIYILSQECALEFGYKRIINQEDTDYPFLIKNDSNPNEFPAYDSKLPLKIPAITHHVWLTYKDNPKEIPEVDLNHMLNSLKILAQGNLKWQHILWTNDADLIPISKSKLEAVGVEIKNINSLNHKLLLEDVDKMLKRSSFSEASDVIRYLALAQYGGIYNDTDVEMFKPIDNLMQQFDFIAAEHRYYYYEPEQEGFDTLGSAFVAAKKDHPVTNTTINYIIRNLHAENLPRYIKNACSIHSKVWVTTGPMALTMAYFRDGNLTKDKNIVFKMGYFYNRCHQLEENARFNSISCHDFNANWYGEKKNKKNEAKQHN